MAMTTTTNKPQRLKIRKNSLTQNLYLDRQGRWVHGKLPLGSLSDRAAERFAQQRGVEVFGLFPCESFGQP